MKLGAQLYSVRTFLQTEEELKNTFIKIKNIGYENVQLSGAPQMDAYFLKTVSEETALPIVCTHSPYDRIIGDTEALINEHKIFGCSVIGLGSMPKDMRGTKEGMDKFFAELEAPVKKIKAVGLDFAYHHHSFEFDKFTDYNGFAFDFIEEKQDWSIILDTYWIEYAGRSAVDYIKRIGGERLKNVHFKDMKGNETRDICHCGEGILDFRAIADICRSIGVENVLVEQDNATKTDDPFMEMKLSYDYLKETLIL